MYYSNKISVKRHQLIEEEDEDEETAAGPLMSLQGGQLNQSERSFHHHGHGTDTNWLATIDSRFFSKKKRFCALLFIILLFFAIICLILTLSFLPNGGTHNLIDGDSAGGQNVLPLTSGHGQLVESQDAVVMTTMRTTTQIAPIVVTMRTKVGDDTDEDNSLESSSLEHFSKFLAKKISFLPPSPKLLGYINKTVDGQAKSFRYYLSETPVNQTVAQERCQKLGPGGTLFRPLSLDEFSAVDKLLRASHVPETWLLWTAGHFPASPSSTSSWSWLPNMTAIPSHQLISPKLANLTHFETFSTPSSSSTTLNNGPAGGLTMFRRKMDFGFCKRFSSEIHDYACQLEVHSS